MRIYVLIIVCLYTTRGLSFFVEEAEEGDGAGIVAALLVIASGVIAIVFQSISL